MNSPIHRMLENQGKQLEEAQEENRLLRNEVRILEAKGRELLSNNAFIRASMELRIEKLEEERTVLYDALLAIVASTSKGAAEPREYLLKLCEQAIEKVNNVQS